MHAPGRLTPLSLCTTSVDDLDAALMTGNCNLQEFLRFFRRHVLDFQAGHVTHLTHQQLAVLGAHVVVVLCRTL